MRRLLKLILGVSLLTILSLGFACSPEPEYCTEYREHRESFVDIQWQINLIVNSLGEDSGVLGLIAIGAALESHTDDLDQVYDDIETFSNRYGSPVPDHIQRQIDEIQNDPNLDFVSLLKDGLELAIMRYDSQFPECSR